MSFGHLYALKWLSEKAVPAEKYIDLMHIPTSITTDICMERSGINLGMPIDSLLINWKLKKCL